jgi:hypothetical protein
LVSNVSLFWAMSCSPKPMRAGRGEYRQAAGATRTLTMFFNASDTKTMVFNASDTNSPIGFCRVECHAQRTFWQLHAKAAALPKLRSNYASRSSVAIS